MVAPCMDCKDRYMGCHGKCEKYLMYKVEKDKLNKKIRAEKNMDLFNDCKKR